MPLQTAILCRTNAPLVKAAFDLIRLGRGIKVKLLGRDIAQALKEVVGEMLGTRRNVDIREFEILADGWINNLRQRYANDERHEAYLAEQEDYCSCIRAIARQCSDARCVYDTIDKFFVDADELDDDPTTIIFASGHRSKGFEWPRVIILRPDLLPHPSAESEADKRQEEHLKYIMKTRGMEKLWICADAKPD